MNEKFNQLYDKIISEEKVIHEGWLGKLATGAALGASLIAGAKAQSTLPNDTTAQQYYYQSEVKEKANECIELARKFIKEHQGTRKDKEGKHIVYKDVKGVDTIGYGSTDPTLVAKKKITEQEALDDLDKQIGEVVTALKKKFGTTVWGKLDQHQKAALISLYYNVGKYKKFTNLEKYIKEGDIPRAASQFLDIDNITVKDQKTGEQKLQKCAGLTQRRADEVNNLFLYWYND